MNNRNKSINMIFFGLRAMKYDSVFAIFSRIFPIFSFIISLTIITIMLVGPTAIAVAQYNELDASTSVSTNSNEKNTHDMQTKRNPSMDIRASDSDPTRLNQSFDFSKRALHGIIIITILSIAPSIIMMITSFTKIVIVFGFLRNALGGLHIPPTQIIMALSFFLTLFIMSDSFQASYSNGIKPMIDGSLNEEDGLKAGFLPFEDFMRKNVRKKDAALFFSMSSRSKKDNNSATPNSNISTGSEYSSKKFSNKIMKNEVSDQASKSTTDKGGFKKSYTNEASESISQNDLKNLSVYSLVPAFMISEIRKGFEIGFLISIPFLVIDMVIGAILMALGMTTTHPATISLPFKIIYFVLIDGWYMICGSLVQSYIVG